MPDVKNGNVVSAQYVLRELGLKSAGGKGYEWGLASAGSSCVEFQPVKVNDNIVPNVMGMGAKDAVCALSNRGMRVRMKGRGKVIGQSVASGSKVLKGQTILLELN